MSFLKITDPNKREQLVQELLNTRRAIKEESYSNHLGKIRIQDKYSKQLKPATDKLDAISKAITTTLDPTLSNISTALAALPSSVVLPQILPGSAATATEPLQIEDISAPESSLEVPQSSTFFGDIASKYLSSVMSGKNTTDTVFGIHTKDGQEPGTFFIGNKHVQIAGNDLIIEDKKYEGTEGLWNLIMNKEIGNESFTQEDWDNYKDIMKTTNALYKPDLIHPKSSRSDKWKSILSPIWEEINPKKSKKGNGLSAPGKKLAAPAAPAAPGSAATSVATSSATNIIYLPSNPDALFDRLELLLASKQAGNTGVRNELVAICTELRRMGQLTDIEYKDLNVIINND
jgi:hypothetical protein